MLDARYCLFALGLSVSLAAACGDDDGDGTSTAGTGGGGSGGTAGTAGTAGRGGNGGGGSAGTAGTGGSAGTAGMAGSAGAAGAGDGAGTGGTGSDDEPDAGPDADVVDSGALGTCPAGLDDLVSGPTAGATTSAVNQEVMITRVVFDGDDIRVTFRGVLENGFNFSTPLVLCTGSEQSNCDGGVAELQGSGSADGGVGNVLPTEEVEYVFQDALVGTETTAASGELALVNGLDPSSLLFPEHAYVRAYVNWGNYTSLPPESETYDDLETRAEADNVWTPDESIELGLDNTIFATGDVTAAAGFQICSQP